MIVGLCVLLVWSFGHAQSPVIAESQVRKSLLGAIALYRKGRYIAAHKQLSHVTRLRPTWFSAHYYLGLSCRLLAKPYARCLQHLMMATKLSRGHAFAYFAIGRLHRENSQNKRAIRALRVALRLSGGLHQARYQLALAYRGIARYDQALAEMLRLKAVKTWTFHWALRRHIARLYERRGRIVEAEREYLFLLAEPRALYQARLELYRFYRRRGLVAKATAVWTQIMPAPKAPSNR